MTNTPALDPVAIAKRCEAATPGPWSDFCESGDWWIQQCDDEGNPVEGGFVLDANELSVEDMNFIVHARSDVPALLAEVETLRDALERLEREQVVGMDDPAMVTCLTCRDVNVIGALWHRPWCPFAALTLLRGGGGEK